MESLILNPRISFRGGLIAINYFGRKITHYNLINEIEKCAKALIASGVKSGDYISLCLLTIPEAVYLIYAINKIGAVCNFLVLSASINDLHKQISVSKSKIVITMDMVTEKILTAAKNTDVTKIISVSVSDSMPVYLSIPLKFKKKCFDIPKTIISWNNFIANGKNTEIPDIITDDNAPAIIEYTGGTTGTPKGVVLSNRASNAFAFNHQLANAIFVIKAGERYLDILPPFYAYGLFSGIHFPLCAGVETILSPDPSPEIFPRLVMRYHAHHFACGPLHIDNLVKEAEHNNLDLSFIKTIAFGGDKVSEEWEKRMTDILEAHGATNVLCNGYGMTETAGVFCLITHKVKKMIPFVKNSVKVIDIDTGVELKYLRFFRQCCALSPRLWRRFAPLMKN